MNHVHWLTGLRRVSQTDGPTIYRIDSLVGTLSDDASSVFFIFFYFLYLCLSPFLSGKFVACIETWTSSWISRVFVHNSPLPTSPPLIYILQESTRFCPPFLSHSISGSLTFFYLPRYNFSTLRLSFHTFFFWSSLHHFDIYVWSHTYTSVETEVVCDAPLTVRTTHRCRKTDERKKKKAQTREREREFL